MFYPLKEFTRKTDLSRYQVWLKQAEYDIQGSRISLEHGFFEWACYQATQAAEKTLKALVVYSGWRPPRTHKLSVLIGIANSVNEKFRNQKFVFRDLEIYTFVSRYPFLLPGEESAPHDFVKKTDAEKCIIQAEEIMSKVYESFALPIVQAKFEDTEHVKDIDISKRLDYIKTKIIECLDPQEIILFGGYAKGKKGLSTLDILVIADTELSFIERIRKVRECTKGGHPVVSPLVYTPSEFNLMLSGGEGFLENAIEEGKVVYSKS